MDSSGKGFRTWMILLALAVGLLLPLGSSLLLGQRVAAAAPITADNGTRLSGYPFDIQASLQTSQTLPAGPVYDFSLTGEGCPACLGADLSLTNSDGRNISQKGSTIAYTLSYANQGADVATGVVITESVPDNAVFVPALSTAGWQQAEDENLYLFPIGNVAKGAAGSVLFAVRIFDTLPPGTATITNTATIGDDGGHGPDKNVANNSSSDINFISDTPTQVCGTINSDTTWRPTQSPYIVTCNIVIPAGRTLTIEPGTEVRFNSNIGMQVNGTLLAQGTAVYPLLLTANHNTPIRGFWDGIDIFNGGQATIEHANITHGGNTSGDRDAMLHVSGGGSLTLNHALVSHSGWIGVYLNPTTPTAPSALADNTLSDNVDYAAIVDLNNGTMTHLRNNDGQGNGVNAIRVGGSMNGLNTWGGNNTLPFRFNGDLNVNTGAKLTVEAGAVFKAADIANDLNIFGTLVVSGTAASPAVFTSLWDDTAGGDTNNDGNSSSPAAGQWGGIYLRPGSSGHVLNYCRIGYGGRDFDSINANVRVETNSALINNCELHHSDNYGIYALGVSFPVGDSHLHHNDATALFFDNLGATTAVLLTGSTFQNNSHAVFLDLVEAAGQITLADNVATANTVNGASIVGTIAGNLNLDAADQSNFALRLHGDLTVRAAARLDLSPGVIFKGADISNDIDVFGTLTADGTAAQPVVFTSIHDDSQGGDTNNNGPATSPDAGHWGGLYFRPGSSGNLLDHCRVAYGGRNFDSINANVRVETNNLTIANCTIQNSDNYGLYAINSSPPITNTTFDSNDAAAIFFDGMGANTNVRLHENTFQGNGGHAVFLRLAAANGSVTLNHNSASNNVVNGLGVDGDIQGTMSFDWLNQANFAIRLNNDLTVQSNSTLDLSPGVIIKGANIAHDLHINGRLLADGTAQQPLVFTSIHDDSYGGDTNNNGTATEPDVGHWGGLNFSSGSSGNSLSQCVLAYGGRNFDSINALVHSATSSLTIDHCTFRNSDHYGILTSGVSLTVTNSAFNHNDWEGIRYNGLTTPQITLAHNQFNGNLHAVWFDLVNAGGRITLQNNTATDNVTNGALIQGTVAGPLNLDWQQQPDFALRLNGDLTVAASGTLQLSPGIIFKGANIAHDFQVYGDLIAAGTITQPIVFTSVYDDSYGGDTNNDGATSEPDNGQWGGIYLRPGSSALLDQCVLAYGGRNFDSIHSLLQTETNDTTLTNCTLKNSDNYGLYALNVSPNIANVIFHNNDLTALYLDNMATGIDLDLQANSFLNNGSNAIFLNLANAAGQIRLADNLATGNATNGVRVQGSAGGPLALDWNDQDDMALVLNGDLTVNTGAALQLSPGVVFKGSDISHDIQVHGTLTAAGSAGRPVVFTSFKDDSYGGDSNNNGSASTPGNGDWGGVYLRPGSSGSFDQCVFSYGGRNFDSLNALLRIDTNNLSLTNCTLQHSNNHGIYLAGTVGGITITNNQISGNSDHGLFNSTTTQVDARNNWWGHATGPRHASNPAGLGDRVSNNVLFNPWLTLIANFTAAPRSGSTPLAIDFSDSSAGNFTSWLWEFGDGITSTVQHPSHVYTTTGVYTVSLTVTGPGGSSRLSRAAYIQVNEPAAPLLIATKGPLAPQDDRIAALLDTADLSPLERDVILGRMSNHTLSQLTTLEEPPPLPDSFYGRVTVEGSNVPSGTIVTAWINGVQYAAAPVFLEDGDSVYRIDVPGDISGTVALEGSVAGDEIVFRVGGALATPAATWQSGVHPAHNLSTTFGVDLTLTAAPIDTTLLPGDIVSYDFVIHNNGPETATGVILEDTLSPYAEFVSASDGGVVVGGRVYWPAVSIPAGQTITRSLTVSVQAALPAGAEQFTNRAIANHDGNHGLDPTPNNNQATQSATLIAAPDLQLTLDADSAGVAPGGLLEYTLVIENNGNQAATGLVLSQTLPAGVHFLTASDSGQENTPGLVTWFPFNLPAGEQASRTVNVQLHPLPTLSVTVSAITTTASIQDDGDNGPDGNPADNSASLVTAVTQQPDIAPAAPDTSQATTDPQTLTLSGNIVVHLHNNGNATVTTPFTVTVFEDSDGDNLLSLGVDNIVGQGVYNDTLQLDQPGSLSIPVAGTVNFRDNLLHAFADSSEVVTELNEANNYQNTAAACTYIPTPGDFSPVVELNWPQPGIVEPTSVDSISTPLIINLTDDNGDGQINEGDTPDIVFVTADHTNVFTLLYPIMLRAIKGDTGEAIFDIEYNFNLFHFGFSFSGLAAGDIDNDGLPEIITALFPGPYTAANRLYAFEHTGQFKWASANYQTQPAGQPAANRDNPTIADLDQDGTPEIIIGANVFNNNGTLRWRGTAGQAYQLGNDSGSRGGAISIVANLDMEGDPELVTGNTAYRSDGSIYWQVPYDDGYPAVANFDGDDYPEIVVVGRGKIRLHEHDGSLIWGPHTLPGSPPVAGGPPTIADFDADGQPEIGVAGSDRYVVYETDGSRKWQANTQDRSSNMTGSTVFDLDGDGRYEVIYRDERFLRIFRGSDGAVLYQAPLTSTTWNEEPVVADVDGDGNAEIIVSSDRRALLNEGSPSGTAGIRVYGDANDNWISARSIWNQNAYAIEYVNDDGTIPQFLQPGWLTHNTFRANSAGPGLSPFTAPDLTASRLQLNLDNYPNAVISARIGNGGSAFAPAGIPIAFYDGNPAAGGTLIGITNTPAALQPGEYVDVTLDWPMSGFGSGLLYVVADDNGSGQDQHNECRENNNSHSYGYDTAVLGLVAGVNDGLTQVTAGQLITYTITILNAFNGPAAGVLLTDTLPAHTAFVAASDGGSVAGNTITWPAFTINSHNTATRTITLQVDDNLPPAAIAITNTVTVSDNGANGPDSTPANNVAIDVDALSTVRADAGGPYSGDEGQPITLDGSGSTDRDGFIVSYEWDLDNDSQYDDATGVSPSAVFPDNGTFTVGLRVTDNVGERDHATAFITTSNLSPTVTAAADPTVAEGAATTLTLATYTDSGTADSHTATLDWGDGFTETISVTAGLVSAAHTYADDGLYSLHVCVGDDDGGQDCTTLEATVTNQPPVVEAGPDTAAVAGETVNLAPATFTDPGTADSHTTTIDWGDGTVESGTVSESNGSGTISGSHSYATYGVFLVEVCVSDNSDAEACDTFFVNLVDQAISQSDGRPSVQPGDLVTYTLWITNSGTIPATGVVATDTLPGYAAFIAASDGGNHDAPNGLVTWTIGSLAVGQSVTRTLTVQVDTMPPAAVTSMTNTAAVADDGTNGADMRPANNTATDTNVILTVAADAGGPYSGNEGEPILLDASGSTDRNGTIVAYAWDLDNDGEFDDATGVTTTVTFGDAGNYLIRLRATDDSGENDVDITTTAVANLAPAVQATTNLTLTEGGTLNQIVATFTDLGSGDTHTATIDWGDGTETTGFVVEGVGSGTVSGIHTYLENGIFTLEICVADDEGSAACDTTSLLVVNSAPFILDTALTDFRLWSSDYLLSCYDGQPDWQVAGDGRTVTQTLNSSPSVLYGGFSPFESEVEGTLRVFSQTLTNTVQFFDDDYVGFVLGYQPDGLNDPTAEYLLVDWKGGAAQAHNFGCGGRTEAQPGLAISRVSGSPADSELWGHVNHTCNGSENGVEELARATTLGSAGWQFNQDYHFTFELSETRLQVYVNGALEIDLAGNFAHLANGRFGFYTYSQADATFSDFAFQAISIEEGHTIEIESLFTDPGTLDTHSATIDWGDGTTTIPTLVEESGSGVVTGSYSYADGDNQYPLELCIADDDGGETCQEIEVNVFNVAPAVDAGPDLAAPAGETVTLAATFTDPGLLDTHTATIDWGDGAVETGVISGTVVSGSHAYAADNVYTAEVCVTDKDGATGCDTMRVNRLDLSLTKSDGQIAAVPGQLITYTLVVNNNGTITATGVQLGDILPAHTLFIAASDGGSYTANNHVALWQIPAVPAGTTLTRTVTVQLDSALPAAVTVITNTAIVSDDGLHGPDENPADNVAGDADILPNSPLAAFAPAKSLNPTLLADGATVAAVSSVWSVDPAYRPENALDSDPNSRWRTGSGQVANQSLTVELAGGRTHVVNQLSLRGSSATSGPRNFELRVSTTGTASADFTTVLTGTLLQSSDLQTFTIDPVQARYVQLVLLDNYGNSYTELYHFHLFTRERSGGILSLLESGLVTIPAHSSAGSGSTVQPTKAIDFNSTTYWETAAGQITGQWIKVDLLGNSSYLVDRIRLNGGSGDNAPREFQIRVSNGSLDDADFQTVLAGTLPQDGLDHWFTFPAVPAQYVQLYILNNHGNASTIRVYDFQVYAANLGGATVPFDDFSRGTDGTVVGWQWDFGDGSASTNQHPVHTYAAPGVYTVTLSITDSNGLTDQTSQTYTVLTPSTAAFTWSPTNPAEAQTTNFSDASINSQGALLGWRWNFPHLTTQPTSQNSSTAFPDDGPFVVTLTITDSQLIAATIAHTVTVRNITPTVSIGPDSYIRRTGEAIVIPLSGGPTFRTVADASAIDLANLTYHWDTGDGRVFTSTAVNFSYPAAGLYTITLTVTDPQGASAQDTMQVTVFDDHAAPEPDIELVGSLNVALPETLNTPSLLGAGSAVVAYSSRFNSGHSVENMLELDSAGQPWASADGQPTNQYAVIRLGDGSTLYTIDRVRLQPRADCCFDQRIKDFEVWVSATTADDWSFTRVLTGTAANNGNLQEFVFPAGAVEAKYVKLVALNNRGSTCCISTTTFEVVTAGSAGPGGIVAASSIAGPSNDANRLLDSASTTFWRTANSQRTNQWVTVLLAGDEIYNIHGVFIQPRSGSEAIRNFLVQVSTTTADPAAFTTVYTGTAQNNSNWQQFFFDDVPARYVRLFVLDNHGSNCCIAINGLEIRASVPREPDGWFNSDVLARITAAENQGGSGLTLIEYSTNSGQSWQPFDQRLFFTNQGSLPLTVRATDLAGNVSQPVHTFVGVDKTHKLTSQESGQAGVNWLTTAVRDEAASLGCVACHVQGDSLHGLALSTATGYQVDTSVTTGLQWLANFITSPSYQNQTTGLWGHPPGGSDYRTMNSSHSLFGLAMYDRYVSTNHTAQLLLGVNGMLGRQQANGRWAIDHIDAPTNQGDIEPTVHMLFALNQAKQRVDPATAATYQEAIDRAVAWLRTAPLSDYNQDRALKLVGLTEAGVPQDDPLVVSLIDNLLTAQFEDGGWAEDGDQSWTSSFATGQSVYALCRAGVPRTHPQVIQGIDWLIHHQISHTPNGLVPYGVLDGPWPLRFTGAGQPFVTTMWPVIALGCYGDLSFDLSVEPSSQLLTPHLPISQTVTYSVTLQNTGVTSDTYHLDVTGGATGWTAALDTTSVTLGSGQTAYLTLTVTAPPELSDGLSVLFSVLATSQNRPDIVRTALVEAITSLPPAEGHATTTTLIDGDGISAPIHTPIRLAATVSDTVDHLLVSGPNSGVVNFLVAGVAVGSDDDGDGDGVYEITWTPNADWISIGRQDLRAIYSGISRPAPATSLLPSFDAGSLTIQDAVDLVITKSDGRTTITPGDVLTYTITLHNSGSRQSFAAVISDTLPAETTFASASHGGALSGNVVTWPGVDLAAGATITRTLVVTVASSLPADTTAITNTVSVHDNGASGADPVPADNLAYDVDLVSTTPTNQPPVALDDTTTTDEDTAVTIPVLTNDSDPDGDSLVITATTQPQHGTAAILSDTLRYTPTLHFNGTDTLTYTIGDGSGATASAVVTITITPVNDDPVAANDEATTEEDTAVTIPVLDNDDDLDGDDLTIGDLSQPDKGTTSILGTTILYTPTLNFNGTDTFTYTISDGNGGTDTATVTVAVEPINDEPVAADDEATTDEDSAVTIDTLDNDDDVDGDTLTIVALGQPAHGTAALNLNNTITYTPTANFNGTDTFTYTVSDGNGGADTATVTVVVDPVNDEPVAADDAATTDEDTAVTIPVLDNDDDPDGDSLTISTVGQPTNGIATVVSSTIVYTPTADFYGTDTFTYTVSDSNGGSDTAEITITVTSVNDEPVAADDEATTDEDTAVTIDVVENDNDPDGDTLTVVTISQPANGTAAIEANAVVYTPTINFNGTDTFTYTVADGNGGSDTATVTITVTSINDEPVAVDDEATTNEDTAVTLDVTGNDDDIDGDTLTIVAVTQPAHGTAVINLDNTVTYTPTTNYNGPDSFGYTIEDGSGGSDTAAVTITVTPINDEPIAADDEATTDEDTAVTVPVLDNDDDLDDDTLVISAADEPNNGTAVINNNTIVYTPTTNFNGTDTFTYTVSDGNGGTDTATVTLVVEPINDEPVAADDEATADEDTAVTIDAVDNDEDIDGDALALIAVSQPANGTAALNLDNTITYTPTTHFNGTDTFTYTVEDGNGGSDIATVTITVTSLNDAPVAVDDEATTDEDTAVTIPVLDNDEDVDGDDLLLSGIGQPANGVATIDGSTLVYTPTADFYGTDTFTYTVSDDNGGFDTAEITINVTSANDEPVAVDDTATTDEDTAVTIAVTDNDGDVDGDSLTVVTVTQPAHGIAAINLDNTVTYTPTANYNGPDTFTYTVEDGNGGSDTATVTLTVEPLNDEPVAAADTATTDEDTTVTIPVLDNDEDIDGDSLTLAAIGQPAHGTAAIHSNTAVYTPTTNFNGTDTFTYTVSDGNGGSDTAMVTVEVNPVNDAPVAADDEATTDEDTAVTIPSLTNDEDIDGDTLTIASVVQPANGTAVTTGATLIYTPTANFYGTDTFTYTVADGNGGTDTAAITVVVAAVNDEPVAADDEAATTEDTAVILPVLTNDDDIEGDTLTVITATQPAHGTAVVNLDNSITYTPTADFHGTDSFSYTIADGNGGEDTATVTVTVAPANDAPVAADDEATTAEDTAVTIPVLDNDEDIDGDTLVIGAAGQPSNGTVTLIGSAIVYTPTANFNGTDTFTYTVSDGAGGLDSAVVTLTVTPVNDQPVAADDEATTDEDTPVTLPVTANDDDVDGDDLTVTTLTQPANGTAALLDNQVVYTPTLNFYGTNTITYTITDGNGGTDTAVITITVTSVNDEPRAADDTAVTSENVAAIIDAVLNDNDLDGDTITIVAVTQPAHGTAAINPDNTLTHTPTAHYNGNDSFTYTVEDGNGGSDTATVSVTITPVNDPPVAVDDEGTTAEDTPASFDVVANDLDIDGDPLTVTAVTQPANGFVTILDNLIHYTPAANYHGPDSLTYQIQDIGGFTSTAILTITVTPVNDPPLAIDDSATTVEDTATTIHVAENDEDIDGDPLLITAVSQPANGTAAILNNHIVYTPTTNFNGTDALTYTVSDGNGGEDSATVTILVSPANDDPAASDDSATTAEDTAVTADLLANDDDLDGDSLSIGQLGLPLHGTAVISGSLVVYTPTADFHGTDTFTYTVSDGAGGLDSATVTITVTPVNDAPVAVADGAAGEEDTPLAINLLDNDYDVDGDTITVTAVTTPTHGTVVLHPDGTVTYTPAEGYFGSDSFSYTINDSQSGTATAEVNILIGSVNDTPNAVNDSATTDEDTAVTIPVLSNDTDPDGDTLTVTVVTLPAHGLATLQPDGTILYTPDPDYNGSDSFSYTAADGYGGSDEATVSLTVQPVNDAPVAGDDVVTTMEDTAVTFPVLDNDSDVDGNPLTITTLTQPANGTAALQPDQRITYTPPANFFGTVSFGYTVSDGSGGTDSATITVTVSSVNDAPVAVNDTASTPSNTAVTLPPLVNDSDIDGGTLTVQSVGQPANGTAVLLSGNLVRYTPAFGFYGTDSFVYTISDGQGGAAMATITVTVAPAGPCELYPIALHSTSLQGVDPGDILEDIWNGGGSGNFGWLTWMGGNGVPALVTSLTPPGNSHTYVNPNNPADHVISAGDWVRGRPGVANAANVRAALDYLVDSGYIITVPIWDVATGSGSNVKYHVVGFAQVQLLDYHLPGQNRITVRFLGYQSCGQGT